MGHSRKKMGWFAADRGGTFTDVIGVDPEGKTHSRKLLSLSQEYADPAIEGIRRMMKISAESPIPEHKVSRIRMGTTVATNALLERKGVPIALLITKGFGDLLEIGNQARPDLFALAIIKPEQLYSNVIEVDERLDHEGSVVKSLDESALRKELEKIMKSGISSLAIVLMHSWKNGIHESRVSDIAFEMGFNQISVSHKIMPLIKIVGRGQTTVVDAYLSPVLFEYIQSVKEKTGNIPLEFMQSSGGMTDAQNFRGKDAIMSGPAGGVIGAAAVAKLIGISETIGFDMGGTSTDVSRYGGEFEKVVEVETSGIHFQTPSLKINTVAAGGGSILWFDGKKMRVGPESAGADPGPACYDKDGQLAITDANLLLGRLVPKYFPNTFGQTHDQPLNEAKTRKTFKKLTDEINTKLGTDLSSENVALGFIRIANETMASAIKEISVARGFDVRTHALVCFGGAAAQHACGIARILGIKKMVIHPMAGLLSAYGIAMANQFRYAIRSIVTTYKKNMLSQFESQLNEMAAPLMKEIAQCGISESKIETNKFLDLRPLGTDNYLTIPLGTFEETVRMFAKLHKQLFGFDATAELELVNLRVEVNGLGHHFKESHSKSYTGSKPESNDTTKVTFEGSEYETPIYQIDDFLPGSFIEGPAIITEAFSQRW